ncbi:MAG: hypothetical protein RRZ24_11335 [Clostridia bacterium]
MKTNKLISVLLALSICLMFMGCQLALENAGGEIENDRLIGVLVTKEHLDLFDIEGYLNDHLNEFSGGDIIIDGNREPYEGRLYATLQERILTNESGETATAREYVFPDIDGISYFAAKIPATEKEDSYTATSSDEAISEGHVSLFYGDTEDKITLDGTIHLAPGEGASTSYLNPVYQAADGSVYAVSGSGMNIGGVEDEGPVMSQTFDESTVITENGEKKTLTTSVKIAVSMMLPPEKVVVLQMNASNQVLSRTEYKPGKLPHSLKPTADTAYILLETRKHDRAGTEIITRELYVQEDETLSVFYMRMDGICIKQQIALEWNP